MFYFLNNRIVPAGEAKISVRDISILRGFGIFDFLRTQHGRPFLIGDYLHRFKTSAQLIGLPLDHSIDELKGLIHELLEVNRLPEAGIRLVLTGGESPNGYLPTDPNFAILIEELHWPDENWYRKGIKLITYPYQREFYQIKSINYLTALMLQPRARNEGAMDILYHNGEEISETTRCNFFIVRDNVIITPDKHILFGVTRKKVLEIARMNFPVEERTINLSELKQADECFVTGTGKKMISVVDIDGGIIGNGKIGKVTKRLMDMFNEFEAGY
jgi:branched-chain amino acid aminotransferase